MRTTNLLGALTALLSAVSAVTTTTIKLQVPPSAQLPNPNVLPPNTHATLTTLGQATHRTPLSLSNTFTFDNITAGSYLADIHCTTHAFIPLRIDVGNFEDKLKVQVWETYRGNDWENKGEEIPEKYMNNIGKGFEVRVAGGKVYYIERASFSVISILKNPMILMGIVSMVLFIGMPKLVENMDPETRAEFEAQQKQNPVSNLMRGGAAPSSGANNFDMAGFLSGHSTSKPQGGVSGDEGAVDSAAEGSGKGRKKR